jgi:trehalose 6-phosphate synthase
MLPNSPGGLVPMLIALLRKYGGQWVFTAPVGWPMPGGPIQPEPDVVLHPMRFPESIARQHYEVVTVRLLLWLLHYLHDTWREPDFGADMFDAWTSYETVNQAYATKLASLCENTADELVLVNDPHLLLVPALLDAELERRRSQLVCFLGTPWSEPDYFGILPERMRTQILTSLLHSDVVGFHARRWAKAFLECCARFLSDAVISDHTIFHRGHRTRVVAVPFPLDVDVVERLGAEGPTERWQAVLSERAQERLMIARADRMDLWKNLPRGFAAYESLLERRPDLAGAVWFCAVATSPTRATERHREYKALCEGMIRRINERFGGKGREAASLVYPGPNGDSRNCVAAALGLADAVLVNPTYDGLNLVAKEAVMLSRGPLLLSANAGVHEQLGPYTSTIHPFDLEATSVALEAALDGTLRPDETVTNGCRSLLRRESPEGWLDSVCGTADTNH